ncbi:zinc finger and SCAN domain-containing protein 29-like [Emydura macquarii macquarii]|uniref:zinc finger and SCAN domain-containing protein 29-like n=1 Tax=Emydura macquarii macquarii TaxID=1129001 RepID=UPI00352A2F6D
MAKGKPKRAPAWSRPEVLDLIGLWGEETVLSQLRSSKRNLDIYGKISQGMLEKGHQRDAYQCRVKIKELRLSYQKAREANRRSGSSPKTCRFYDEVHAILGGDPTTMPPQSIDTSAASQSMSNEDESLEDEIVESREHENGVSLLPESQELILTPEQSTSTQDSTNDPMEGTSEEVLKVLREQLDVLWHLVDVRIGGRAQCRCRHSRTLQKPLL